MFSIRLAGSRCGIIAFPCVGRYGSWMAYRILARMSKVWFAVVGMKDEYRVEDPAGLDARAYAMCLLWIL
jgi:hypothetical protein